MPLISRGQLPPCPTRSAQNDGRAKNENWTYYNTLHLSQIPLLEYKKSFAARASPSTLSAHTQRQHRERAASYSSTFCDLCVLLLKYCERLSVSRDLVIFQALSAKIQSGGFLSRVVVPFAETKYEILFDSLNMTSDPSIADTAESVRQLLSCCQEIPDGQARKSATTQLARFNLWASNIGVFAERHASLDYRLRTAPYVTVAVQGNLERLCQHLLSILKATANLAEQLLDDFSELSQQEVHNFGISFLNESFKDRKHQESSNIQETIRLQELSVVEETIDTLHQLSLAIRKASNRNSLTRVPNLFDLDDGYVILKQIERTTAFSEYDSLVKAIRYDISSSFEAFVRKVLMSRWLRPAQQAELDSRQKQYRDTVFDRCVKLVSARRRQLTYFRNHQLKLASGLNKTQKSTWQTKSEFEDQLRVNSENERLKELSPLPPVTFEVLDAAPSETVGSELRSTVVRLAPPSYAPSSTASSTAEGGFRSGDMFEVPPPPKLEIDDKEKLCPYCCLVLPAKIFSTEKRAKRWERHLLDDLQPYICLFENCTQQGKSYSSFKDWQMHLSQSHTISWTCSLHPDDPEDADDGQFLFDKLNKFRAHIDTYHPELDVPEVEDLIHRGSHLAMLPDWCFVCFEQLPSPPTLQKHMANHFKSMSLLALPWREDFGDDNAHSSKQLRSYGQTSDAGRLSESEFTTAHFFGAESDQSLSTQNIQPEEFASMLSVIDANPISGQDRVHDPGLWKDIEASAIHSGDEDLSERNVGAGDDNNDDNSAAAAAYNDGVDDDWTKIEVAEAKTKFKQIVADITTGYLDLREPLLLEEFIMDNSRYLGVTLGKEDDQENLLHYLGFFAVDKEFDQYAPLIKHLLQQYPYLMTRRDSNDRTPLCCAIGRKRDKLVRFMCRNFTDIDLVFRIPFLLQNCIHHAIRRCVSPSLAIVLIELASEETLCEPDENGLTPLHVAVQYEFCTASQLQVVEALIAKCSQALDKFTNKNESPYQLHEETRARAEQLQAEGFNTEGSQQDKGQVTAQSAKAISDALKLHYMRTHNVEEVSRFLYGQNSDYPAKSLTFELGQAISKNRLELAFGNLEFENILQAVSLDNEIFEDKRREQDNLETDDKLESDLVFIFDWLRSKKVGRIIQVHVLDIRQPSHSGPAIIRAVWNLKVEILNWKQTDLDIATIRAVGPYLREVYLYWSGDERLLGEWSGTSGLGGLGGLGGLENLKVVHLHFTRKLPTEARGYVAKFENALMSLSTNIRRVEVVGEFEPEKDESGEKTHRKNTHQWLRTMDAFASFIKRVDIPSTMTPVVVALIDDGCEPTKNQVGGISFDATDNLQAPYLFTSSTGHGILMSMLIVRVCPLAQLFVLKIPGIVGANGQKRFNPVDAAKAVRAAIERKVDVISMPWALRDVYNTADMAIFDSAIMEAAYSGIFIFWAAAEHEFTPINDFVGLATSRNFFKIGGSEPNGSTWKWKGDPRTVDFVFPGEYPEIDDTDYTSWGKEISTTKDSIATALASGLAALIICCFQLAVLSQPQRFSMADNETLSGDGKMRAALLSLITQQAIDSKFIEVSDVFGSAQKTNNFSLNNDDRLEILAELVERLVNPLGSGKQPDPAINPTSKGFQITDRKIGRVKYPSRTETFQEVDSDHFGGTAISPANKRGRRTVYHTGPEEHPRRILHFQGIDSDNYEGTVIYSADKKTKVINHAAGGVEEDARLRTSKATHSVITSVRQTTLRQEIGIDPNARAVRRIPGATSMWQV